MSTSLLFHAYGLTKHEYINSKYKGNKVIFKVKTKENKLCCRVCGSKSVIKQGIKERDFQAPPMGNKQIILRAIIQRLEYRRCNNLRQEKIDFADEKRLTREVLNAT